MSYGIEIYNENGVRVMGMDDFTYTQIFETTIPEGNTNYNITVPGYSDNDCVVMFTPTSYVTGEQPIVSRPAGFVPVYQSPGGNIVRVVRNTASSSTAAARMQVFRIFGGG